MTDPEHQQSIDGAELPAHGPPSVVAESASTTGLSKSGLDGKCLGDLVANINKGCGFGCLFCLNKDARTYRCDPGGELEDHGVEQPTEEWGDYVFYRVDLPEAVRLDCHRFAKPDTADPKYTDRGQGVVFMSIQTDPYLDARTAEITGTTLDILGAYGHHVRILTRNPTLAWNEHADRFRWLADRGLVTVGTSISSLHDERVRALEPNAPPPSARLDGLRRFSDAGVPVYVSMSPTYPTADGDAIDTMLATVAELDPSVVFHEPINPHGGNFEDCIVGARAAGETHLADHLARFVDDDGGVQTAEWSGYALRQFRAVQRRGADRGLPVHLWPDKRLVEAAKGANADWMAAWRDAQSPEPWPEGRDPRPADEMPAVPNTLPSASEVDDR